jgi:hypothetical protein
MNNLKMIKLCNSVTALVVFFHFPAVFGGLVTNITGMIPRK